MVAQVLRNPCPSAAGIRAQVSPERVPKCARNTHALRRFSFRSRRTQRPSRHSRTSTGTTTRPAFTSTSSPASRSSRRCGDRVRRRAARRSGDLRSKGAAVLGAARHLDPGTRAAVGHVRSGRPPEADRRPEGAPPRRGRALPSQVIATIAVAGSPTAPDASASPVQGRSGRRGGYANGGASIVARASLERRGRAYGAPSPWSAKSASTCSAVSSST